MRFGTVTLIVVVILDLQVAEFRPSPMSAQPPTSNLSQSGSNRRGLIEVEAGLGETNQNPERIGLWSLIREDLRTHDGDWLAQGFWALAVHRFGNWRMGIRWRWLRLPFSLLYKFLFKFVEWTCGISLSYTTKVGRRVHLWHHSGMQLGARSIGNEVHIRQCTTFGIARTGDPNWAKPIIEDRADIGCGVCILGTITIGHDSVIGAHAVVTRDVPPYAVVVGIPAKVIGYRNQPEGANALPSKSATGAPETSPACPDVRTL